MVVFFFFNQLYEIKDIKQAFRTICLEKMRHDGYFDMSIYIYGRIRKEKMRENLRARNSKYASLYNESFPDRNEAYNRWIHCYGERPENEQAELAYEDSVAIVNWVYRTMKDADERTQFTIRLFEFIKELSKVKNDIKFEQGVFYNSRKIKIEFFSSVSAVNSFVSSVTREGTIVFFRGHADANYMLCPSVMRSKKLLSNERNLYNEIIIECPDDFLNCNTHLEKLVKMQHYGLPTRLLDITRNLLVALYFACEDKKDSFGELVLISAASREIKYPQSDTVSILASLPAFSHEEQYVFRELSKDISLDGKSFNDKIARLIQEVRLEKPAFRPEVKKSDLQRNLVISAPKSNQRIVRQDGAFILCGLSDRDSSNGYGLNSLRLKKDGKTVIVLLKDKDKILEELNLYSINRASLFPEIECVAEYLRDKYS